MPFQLLITGHGYCKTFMHFEPAHEIMDLIAYESIGAVPLEHQGLFQQFWEKALPKLGKNNRLNIKIGRN